MIKVASILNTRSIKCPNSFTARIKTFKSSKKSDLFAQIILLELYKIRKWRALKNVRHSCKWLLYLIPARLDMVISLKAKFLPISTTCLSLINLIRIQSTRT